MVTSTTISCAAIQPNNSNMMLLLLFITLCMQIQISNCQALDSNGISLTEEVLAIERLMLTPGTIDFQVAPCDFFLNGPPPLIAGDQTSAEWVRTGFHDFITADIEAGTGGLDASVGFESGRPENLGTIDFDGLNFIDRTIIGFNLFSNVFISTSDFIAIGIAEAVLSCDPNSPMIQLRARRIDATEAGPFGVPGPGDSVATQAAAFTKAGFNQTEMIQVVACGHSLGGVHGVNFPQIVGNQPTVGLSEVDYFDDTPFVFDNVGLLKYLNGTGKAGGPLVTTSNTTFQSDKRLFEKDNNAIVKAMAKTQTSFENTCFTVFEKMINTVPKTVTLSGIIGPSKWITMHTNLDFTATNAVAYSGAIATYGKTAAPQTASYQYGTASGGASGTKTSQAGEQQSPLANNNGTPRFPFFGNTTYYAFNDTIDSTVTSITIAGTYTEAISQNLFVVPSMSFVDSAGPKVLVRAALLTKLSPAGTILTATLYYPSGQTGSQAIAYKQAPFNLTSFTKKGAYTIFQGNLTQPANVVPPNGGGAWHVDVKLGTTQRSVKAQVAGNIGLNDFIPCSQENWATC